MIAIYDDADLHSSWRRLSYETTSAKKTCVLRLSGERMPSVPHDALIYAHLRSFASSVSVRLRSFVRSAFYRL